MPEDVEDRFKRAMDRLFTPSTPAPASVAGLDRHGVHGGKDSFSPDCSLMKSSRSSDISPLSKASPSNTHKVCRPWDRGDLFRRLATFKSMTWFGKPEVAGPVNCARKGWVNVDVDLIVCESCNAMLSFPSPVAWSQHEVEIAATAFSEKLESAHKALCPWKGNACSETLIQFPPTPAEVLVEGFKDRCDALYQLRALPLISSSTIDFLKTSKSSQVDCLLRLSTPTLECSSEVPDGASHGSLPGFNYYQSQKIISLCGWELRLLPYVVDCEDDNTESVRISSQSPSDNNSNKQRRLNMRPNVLLSASKKENVTEKEESLTKSFHKEKYDVGSAVLDCTLCGASVGLWLFSVTPRPPRYMSAAFSKSETGLANASGIEQGSRDDLRKGKQDSLDATGDTVTSGVTKLIQKPPNMLSLKLTIAGGPPPTKLCQLRKSSFESHVVDSTSLKNSEEINGPGLAERKRKRFDDDELDEAGENRRKSKILVGLSSVDAVDTCQSRRENSAESVEMPEETYSVVCMEEKAMSSRTFQIPNSRKPVDMNVSRTEYEDSTESHKTSNEAMSAEAKANDFGRILEEDLQEFDPVLQHRHFCPWVNGNNVAKGLCGWQLTLDALEASPAITRSESASSMYNADPLSSVRKILGRTQTTTHKKQ